jgi:hypothetical protein
MPDLSRSSTWCQGDIFVLRIEGKDETIGVVASHDCDLCASSEVEPEVEYIPIRRINDADGLFVFGKSPRKLHCKTLTKAGEVGAIEMLIRERTLISKDDFFKAASPIEISLLDTEKVVFRSWLAARYARSAFPDAFEARLDSKLRRKIEKLSENSGQDIRAIYFDLDDGKMVERQAGDPYQLRIHVVYDTETDDDNVAYEFAESLSTMFMTAFYDDKSRKWHDVVLLSCEATSAYEFPLVLANALKPWRVDHRSYQALPDAIYPDPAR